MPVSAPRDLLPLSFGLGGDAGIRFCSFLFLVFAIAMPRPGLAGDGSLGIVPINLIGRSSFGAPEIDLEEATEAAILKESTETQKEAEGSAQDQFEKAIDMIGEPGWIVSLEDALKRASVARQGAMLREAEEKTEEAIGDIDAAGEHATRKNCTSANELAILHRLDDLHMRAEKFSIDVRAQSVILESAKENEETLDEALHIEGE